MNKNEEERNLGIRETPHFKGLTEPQVYLKSEIGFINFILEPLFEAANDFMESSLQNIMDYLKETKEHYAKKLEEITPQEGEKQNKL